MASVKVAVRVRPLNEREMNLDSPCIVSMVENKTTITNSKVPETAHDRRKEFSYDYSYWSADRNNAHFVDQDQVFKDLGMDVIHNAYEGYNACVFAYGQTGSGKTFTMMGAKDNPGLIPRICQELFARMKDADKTYRTEVSYLEIYNEKVRDLLRGDPKKVEHTLRVREHPKDGPYVQDLSKHIVMNYEDIHELIDKGNVKRTTASTNMNDVSSRSHAIFTIVFTQAKFSKDAPSEMHSKINLVDLAGSERADATGATGQRLKEGGSINKSLVSLGNVIATLAEMSNKDQKKLHYIPYRDSTLTWLLKDSLGGNSKTIMVATISPADVNYGESLSTLRYAKRAGYIINKPTVNEDPNVKLIRELRLEISRLRALLGGNIDTVTTPRVKERLCESEARVKVLTEEWAGKWSSISQVLEGEKLELRKQGLGVVLDSELPHLIGIDDDLFSTGIMLYHLKEGVTTIGTDNASDKQDIVLTGPEVEDQHCLIEHKNAEVILLPLGEATCLVNGNEVSEPTTLTQGAVIVLGRANMFRFNHPQQVEQLKKQYQGQHPNMNMNRSLLSQSMTDLARSSDTLALGSASWELEQRHQEQAEALEEKRREIEEMEARFQMAEKQRADQREAKETEFEENKKKLEQMYSESEVLRREAELEKENAKKEAEKAKRKSMNFEKQLQDYRAHIQQQQDSTEKSDEQLKFDGEKDRLKEMLKDERDEFPGIEGMVDDKYKVEKGCLDEEKNDLTSKLQGEYSEIEDKKNEINEKKEKNALSLRDAMAEISKLQQTLNDTQTKEFLPLEEERKLIDSIKGDPSLFQSLRDKLSQDTVSSLAPTFDELVSTQSALADKERLLYAEYTAEVTKINEAKEQKLFELKERRDQLKVDEVIFEDFEQTLESRYENAASAVEREALEVEMEELEKERLRIEEEQEELASEPDKINVQYNTDSEKLVSIRSQQVEILNGEREKVKQLTNKLQFSIQELLDINASDLESVKRSIAAQKHDIEEVQCNFDMFKDEMERENLVLDSNCSAIDNSYRSRCEDCERRLSELQCKETCLHKDHADEMDRLNSMREILDEMSIDTWDDTVLTPGDLMRKQELLLKYRHLKGDISDFKMYETPDSSDTKLQKQLQRTSMEVQTLENQLTQREAELEEKRQQFERERGEELDRIDNERFKLQEMEDEERINALVEKEVKGRMFEERVRREKRRQLEREKEKMERENELMKIRNSHQKELSRLKQKFEAVGNIARNAPTRANPYANVMSGDATPVKVARSRSFTTDRNMGRAQSLPSLFQSQGSGRPIQICIPGFVQRGAAFDSHHEFEIKITVLGDSWSVFRRYSRIRDFHNDLRNRYCEVAALVFPPKIWFGNKSEKVGHDRQIKLEAYLKHVMEILQRHPQSPLHSSKVRTYSKQVLCDFHPFFKKGVFETTRHGTG